MLPFRKIIYPVDYSEASRAVAPFVNDFVQKFSAELTLVYAFGPETLTYSEAALTDPYLPQETQRAEEARIKAFAAEMFPTLRPETMVRYGDPAIVIEDVIRHQGGDLVMMSTHGRGPVRRFLLGSVATKILHDVSAAVWAATASAMTVPSVRIPYRSILCPVDQTEEAEVIVRGAAALAKAYNAKLHLIQAVEMPPSAAEVDISPFIKELTNVAESHLRELKSSIDVPATHSVVDGPIAEAVRKEAIRLNADLIVTGRGHAQEGLGRVWSHLYPIIREAPCPVLSL